MKSEKLWRTLPYHRRLFLLLLAMSWLLVACFVTFQYGREKRFKAEQLNGQLQMLNATVIDDIDSERHHNDSLTVARAAERAAGHLVSPVSIPVDSIRLTVVDLDGSVLFDSTGDTIADNHSDRPEIAEALSHGTGYALHRHSTTTGDSYFYSATRGEGYIVRSAVTYSLPLEELLAADSDFLWFMLGVTVIISIIGYIATRRLGNTITRLNRFAEKAERGEQIYADEAFPHDELGDISNHIVRLYARLQKATENLNREHRRTLFEEQEKIRIKKQLTNNINHELKTPVSGIQACLETLLDHPDLDDERRQAFIQRAYANSERLCSLLNDVSTITRMDEASQMIDKEPVSLRRVVSDIVDECRIRTDEMGITVHIDGFTDDSVINGNAPLLASVFRNLTDNALAYSGCSNIYIRLTDSNDELCRLTYADDGTGVEEKHLPHLFERFYRIDKGRSRKMGGTGLGLAIVNNAIQLHGGTITATNRPEGGLEFVFTLKRM